MTWNDCYGDLDGTGLNLSANGLVSGIPLIDGMISFTARVQDTSAVAQRLLTITVNPHLTITTPPVLEVIAGMPYRGHMTCSGGTGSTTWEDLENNLREIGLTLSENGYFSGTPPGLAELDFTAQVWDIAGDTTSSPMHISAISPGLYLPGDANNDGVVNTIDFVYLENYFMGGIVPPLILDCPPHGQIYAACDANGSCIVNGVDLTYLVKFFKGGPDLRFCVDCPPVSAILRADPKAGKSKE
jgi:hypothetical protein